MDGSRPQQIDDGGEALCGLVRAEWARPSIHHPKFFKMRRAEFDPPCGRAPHCCISLTDPRIPLTICE